MVDYNRLDIQPLPRNDHKIPTSRYPPAVGCATGPLSCILKLKIWRPTFLLG